MGSIREDVKVHYWWSDKIKGPYQNYSDNVLIPQGNYAARISHEEDKFLIWNFFYQGLTTKGRHLMAPPKELVVDENGELRLKTFSGFDRLSSQNKNFNDLIPLKTLFENKNAFYKTEESVVKIFCDSGFEAFLLKDKIKNFKLTGEFNLEGYGKYGMVFRLMMKETVTI